jgi:hypothetical protein
LFHFRFGILFLVEAAPAPSTGGDADVESNRTLVVGPATGAAYDNPAVDSSTEEKI